MKKVVLLITLLAYCSISASSPKIILILKMGSVTGKVVDRALEEPIPYASIIIKSEDGSEIITGGITQEDGSFEVDGIPEGSFIVEVQFIGYKTNSKLISISKDKKRLNLGTIQLDEEAQQLSEVEVEAERTTIEQKIDRKVINVGKDLTTTGATASDIMNNIPSVNVDQQSGELSLRGNSNVRVMVDGKLSNVPIAQLLRQLPSTSIKSIELITNPSAKFNPEGMSGIINIVLRKNANIGFNGTLNTGLTKGQEAKFNSSIDLNYRNGKFNLYGNYGNNIGKHVKRGFFFRDEENSEQRYIFINNDKSHLYKVGVDFFLNDKNVISFFTNQNIYNGTSSGDTDVLYYNDISRNSQQLFSSDLRNSSEQYNFDYKMEFEKEGHSIELEADHSRFGEDDNTDFKTTGRTLFPDYKDFADTKRTQTIVNLDYVNPLDSISKLEVGLEARVFETNIDYSSTGLSFNSSGNLLPTPETDFVYGMDIFSAYASFGQNYEKWSYQAGIRVENVEVKADTNTVRSFTDKYTQIYPSAFLTYSPTEKNQFQLSFSRRVDRPGLDQVNPIRQWSTPLMSSFGNPDLTPQFTNSYEANYTRRLTNGSITGGIFYRAIRDEINRTAFIDRLDLNKIILSYDNFDDTSAYGVELSTNYKPFKWWSINASFDLFSQTQRGITERLLVNSSSATEDDILMEKAEVQNTGWNLRMNNNFKATKKLTLQLFAFYRGPNRTIQFKVKPMYSLNTGARYSFAQGKGTLSLNFTDVFNTMRFAYDATKPYFQKGQINWESRTVFAGLSYMFGSGKNRSAKRKRRDNNTKRSNGIF